MSGSEDVQVTVILPTYEEAANLPRVVPAALDALAAAGVAAEVLVVDDDSPDGTAEVARELGRERRVRAHVRTGERGLSSAVIAGFSLSEAPVCVVMDADGSHPADALPAMVRPVLDDRADVVVGSRHVPGGGAEGWPLKRRVISRGAGLLARGLSPMTDPTTGFMAVRTELAQGLPLDGLGFKIVLETVVRGWPLRLEEVPIVFTDRIAGESKLSGGVTVSYLQHLARLYRHRLGVG
jgi:dolichol-phosphate mannosyltransferase